MKRALARVLQGLCLVVVLTAAEILILYAVCRYVSFYDGRNIGFTISNGECYLNVTLAGETGLEFDCFR